MLPTFHEDDKSQNRASTSSVLLHLVYFSTFLLLQNWLRNKVVAVALSSQWAVATNLTNPWGHVRDFKVLNGSGWIQLH